MQLLELLKWSWGSSLAAVLCYMAIISVILAEAGLGAYSSISKSVQYLCFHVMQPSTLTLILYKKQSIHLLWLVVYDGLWFIKALNNLTELRTKILIGVVLKFQLLFTVTELERQITILFSFHTVRFGTSVRRLHPSKIMEDEHYVPKQKHFYKSS